MRRTLAAVSALAVSAALVSGCSFKGLSSAPLPGGVDVGDDPYDVKVHFANVLDLVPQSQCRHNDVPVGRVVKVELEGWTAVVTCRVRRDVKLPDNAVAAISQTSLLGEKFVALSPPQDRPAADRLSDGDVIPLSRTSRNAEVEEVLSAMSMLITGGGLEQIATINSELTAAMRGREDKTKSVLRELNTLVGSLDKNKSEIVKTIDKVDKLAARLRKNKKTITDAIDSTTPAVKILSGQRADLTKLLVNLDRLGTVGSRVIRRSRDDTLANLRSLQPLLKNLNKANKTLPKAMEMLVTFPFGPSAANMVRGDYANLMISLDLDVGTIAHNLLAGTPLEGLAKQADKLRGLLTPPNTGLQETPLGVLTPGTAPRTPGRDTDSILPPLSQGIRTGQSPDGNLDALLSGGVS